MKKQWLHQLHQLHQEGGRRKEMHIYALFDSETLLHKKEAPHEKI
jgi:hypothetical protein